MGENPRPDVLLARYPVHAIFDGEHWDGTAAAQFEYLMGLGRLPWPIRMSIRTEGPGMLVLPEPPEGGNNEAIWVPSLLRFTMKPEKGMTVRAELFMPPPEDRKQPLTLAHVKAVAEASEAEMAAAFKRAAEGK